MLTIETATEVACEMHNSLSKTAIVALVEDITGEAWADVADDAVNHIASWVLECAGQPPTQDSQSGAPIGHLIDVNAAAKELGVGPNRVRVLLSEGRIPGAQKIGRQWMIPQASLAAVSDRRPGRPKAD